VVALDHFTTLGGPLPFAVELTSEVIEYQNDKPSRTVVLLWSPTSAPSESTTLGAQPGFLLAKTGIARQRGRSSLDLPEIELIAWGWPRSNGSYRPGREN
jgi:hypothetical protein